MAMPFSGAAAGELLTLYPGEARTIPMESVRRVVVGNGAVVKARVLDGEKILLVAGNEGMTTLLLWGVGGREATFDIHVRIPTTVQRLVPERMVQMEVRLVEFRRQALEKLGISWQQTINGPSFATVGDFASTPLFRGTAPPEIASGLPNHVSPFQTYLGVATLMRSAIDLMAQNGDAFILAEPTLSCRSGGEAKFLAGGELPIPVRSSLGETSVEFKPFGVVLDFAPVADAEGRLATRIRTEVSAVDEGTQVLGVPGFLTRRTETELSVRDGETIVISGLLDASAAAAMDGLPGLSDLPVLGRLFQSREFRDRRTELVVFVTPRIRDGNTAPALAPAARAMDEGMRRRIEAMGRRLGPGLLDGAPPGSDPERAP